MNSLAFVRHARRAFAIKSIVRVSLSVSLALCTPLPALAQNSSPLTPNPVGLSPVVVTAARLEQPLSAALPSTRVIDREEIERSQAPDLAGLLRMFTSIEVAQSGPLGAQTSVFLRGGDSRQTLVLVDGMPINRADFGIASIQHLPLEQIERVEIVRGNVSSLFGAQAVGGVIQVFTRRAIAPQASVEIGSRGTRAASVTAGTRLGDALTPTDLSASVSSRRTDGFSAKNPATSPGANPDRDGASQTGGNLRVTQTWAPGHTTSVALLADRTRGEFDAYTPDLVDVLTTRLDSVSFDSRHRLSNAWDVQASLGEVSERFKDPTGPLNYGAADGRNRVRRAGLQLQWQPTAGQTLQLGAESHRERFLDTNTQQRTRDTDSLRMAWLAAPVGEPWQAQLALRHDENNSFGNATTGLAAIGWQLAPQWKLGLQAATAFSAPSLVDEQYANPAQPLKAERSRSAEASLQWSQGVSLLRAGWFVQRQRDRVDFDPVTYEAGNIARASNRGLEIMAETLLGEARLGAELTLQDPRNEVTDERLLRRSRNSMALRYSQDWRAWQWGAALRYTGERRDTDPATFLSASNLARTTADLTMARALGDGWRLAVSAQNLGGSDRPDVLGFNPVPRGVFVTLRWNGESGTR